MKECLRKPKVHYLSLYSIPEFAKQQRRHSPSAQKMEYIIDAMNRLGYSVNFVSFSESKRKRIYLPRKKKLSENLTFFLSPHIPGRYRESVAFRWFVHCYARKHIKEGDILLVYHTNGMRNDLIEKVCKKKKCTMIYEVEEIYAYVNEVVSQPQVEAEKQFLQCADKYLFCSELLQQAVNIKNLPYVVVEGSYKWTRPDVTKFNDGKIHCVYGGTIGGKKRGGFLAVEMAKYLPENYVIHILGFGETEQLKAFIEQTSHERKCEVIFEGLKKGKEYLEFISKCDVGLAIQTMDKNLCNHSFPSKLVLYMACGLPVLTPKMEVLVVSKMASKIKFYEIDDPKAIAEALLEMEDYQQNDTKELMDLLDREFLFNLDKLFSEK